MLGFLRAPVKQGRDPRPLASLAVVAHAGIVAGRIYVKHPDYLSDYLPQGLLPIPVIQQPPLEELFDRTAVMVMADGEILEGQVTAARSGRPISGARIYLTDVPWFDKPRTTTDKDGRFEITPEPGRHRRGP